jgi:hypothetical protein
MPIPKVNIEGAKKCPSCGSEKKATDQYVKELIKGKYLPSNYPDAYLQLQVPFMIALQSPLNLQQHIPILIINYAICGECFILYVTGITSIEGQAALPPPAGGRGPMNFPQMKG